MTRVKICAVADIPLGEMRCLQGPDRRLLIAHTEQGFFAADEMCTHEDARLCDGNLNGTLVKCPLHGSRFDLTTGTVLDDPAEDNLRVYPVQLIDDDVHVELS